MKKNILIKGILVLIVITLLTVGFTGCYPTPIFPTTGTVIITIAGSYTYYNYNIYLDSWSYQIGVTSGGMFTATNISPGWHTFYADDTVWLWYWDSYTVYVTAGQTSYITLYPW
jgi:hypothetical protein